MVDKDFCASSYLALRYIEKEDVDFYKGIHHQNIPTIPIEECTFVNNASEIDEAIAKVFEGLKNEKLGILLSGGMDSANLASYMRGADAYTFRFLNGDFQKDELSRAEYYARQYNLKLHYVDINWDVVIKYLPDLMKAKAAPVHSIEPQILIGAMQAKEDGITTMIVGESSDLLFGGMDQLLSKDWQFDEFMQRYIFTQPEQILVNPKDVCYLFERYRQEDKIDFLRFMDDVFSIESSSSYWNAFSVANMKYVDPYAKLRMSQPLDLHRVRNGEPKYLIRQLFAMKYPDFPIPNKVPMPRPVDKYFENWSGPVREEFRNDIDLKVLTGNQKWQIYCLEQFFNMFESKN